ncbi:hypothetical protein KIN20_026837 [Parelaphostrongylus tenuis]|uniref:Uncharacterized protein n=1 Tax=Parelaphostrongylus tenuis TaxID=148309 RepID=A0AAD5QYL8_PARTN|nr:hypothetical protein KIN20_026837 [Parelaphostrongylus tenuis]
MDLLCIECNTKYQSIIENWKKAQLDQLDRYRVSSRNEKSSASTSAHLDDSIEVIDIFSSPERDVKPSIEDRKNDDVIVKAEIDPTAGGSTDEPDCASTSSNAVSENGTHQDGVNNTTSLASTSNSESFPVDQNQDLNSATTSSVSSQSPVHGQVTSVDEEDTKCLNRENLPEVKPNMTAIYDEQDGIDNDKSDADAIDVVSDEDFEMQELIREERRLRSGKPSRKRKKVTNQKAPTNKLKIRPKNLMRTLNVFFVKRKQLLMHRCMRKSRKKTLVDLAILWKLIPLRKRLVMLRGAAVLEVKMLLQVKSATLLSLRN